MLGCGRVSHDFTQALKHLPTQKVVACSARSLESAMMFAEKHGIGNHCKSLHSVDHFFSGNIAVGYKIEN
jgi:predicted dehydrogenase